jgi:pyrroline-5-carboxylate reductase
MLALYGHLFSSYTWKALIALYANGTGFEFRPVDPDHPRYAVTVKREHPAGKFPVLVDGDTAVFEATAIVEYLAVKHPGPAPLIPSEPLDAVTAISGSGPAYVFYVAEAMVQAAVEMGLSAEQGRELALATFAGAAALAQGSDEGLDVLRERVTSKGGTTHAALVSLEAAGVAAAFRRALQAARERARELGDQFG